MPSLECGAPAALWIANKKVKETVYGLDLLFFMYGNRFFFYKLKAAQVFSLQSWY